MARLRAMLALGLLAWLDHQPREVATVRFAGESGPEFAEALGWDPDADESPCPLTLFVSGIHPFDDREALLYGSIDTAPGAYRSLVLRTGDAAASWTEVMAPLPGSAVLDVSFTSSTHGRALVGWVVEGPGTLWAYGTEDGGHHWQRLAEIDKPHPLDQPVGLHCPDRRRCLVRLECENEPEGPGHLLETRDGGHRWLVRKAAPSPARPQTDITTAADGTSWQVADSQDDDAIQLLRRRAAESAWSSLPRLPRSFWRTSRGELLRCSAPARY